LFTANFSTKAITSEKDFNFNT